MPSSNKTPSRNKGTQTRGENLNTSWTTDEEAFLVNFLVDRKSEGSSNSVFKDSTFAEVAAAFASSPTTGTPKNMQSCKSKWGRLKKSYNTISILKSKSGFTWSDEHGMGVTEETQSEWDELVKVCEMCLVHQ
ncbi:hypothetical protein BC827DRAFT_1133300 [Russula dissimulans]|nr:hypothetical protein BC827DRAFT_1133300 [Russula dissimulans]